MSDAPAQTAGPTLALPLATLPTPTNANPRLDLSGLDPEARQLAVSLLRIIAPLQAASWNSIDGSDPAQAADLEWRQAYLGILLLAFATLFPFDQPHPSFIDQRQGDTQRVATFVDTHMNMYNPAAGGMVPNPKWSFDD